MGWNLHCEICGKKLNSSDIIKTTNLKGNSIFVCKECYKFKKNILIQNKKLKSSYEKEEIYGRKWSFLENWTKEERMLFFLLVPTIPTIIYYIILSILFLFGNIDHSPIFLIIIGILLFIGLLGLAIRIGGTHDARKLTKKSAEKQKCFAIAMVISIMIMPIWIVAISTFTTQTDYSEVDPILIERGIIEDKSNHYYLSSQVLTLILLIISGIQIIILYFILRFFQKKMKSKK